MSKKKEKHVPLYTEDPTGCAGDSHAGPPGSGCGSGEETLSEPHGWLLNLEACDSINSPKNR